MNKQILNKTIRNETGSGLVLSLMVLLVLSVLGATLGVVTVGSYRLADNTQESNSAYYIAEAGANMAYEEIKKEVMAIYEDDNITSESLYYDKISETLKVNRPANYKEYDNKEFKIQLGKSPKATVRVESPVFKNDSIEYTLVSTGEILGKNRTVEKPFIVQWQDKDTVGSVEFPNNAAIIFKDSLYIGGDSTIIGDILYEKNGKITKETQYTHTNGAPKDDIDISVFFANAQVNNIIQDRMESQLNKAKMSSHKILNSYISYPHDQVVNSTIINTQGDIHANERVTFNGNIIVENGNIDFNNQVKVNGNIIVLNGNIDIGNSTVITGDIINVTGNIDIGHDSIITGNILAKNGDINIYQNKVYGAIISGEGKIETHNMVEVEGVLIAKNVILSSNNIIKYSKKNIEELSSITTGSSSYEPEEISELISSSPTIEQ